MERMDRKKERRCVFGGIWSCEQDCLASIDPSRGEVLQGERRRDRGEVRPRRMEGWASLPQPLLQEAAAYRIDDLYYYSSSYSRVTLRPTSSLSFSACLPACLPACRVPFAPPLATLSPFHLTPHVCGIFLRKIDRPSDCLSRRGFPLCPFRTAPCRACPFLHLPPPSSPDAIFPFPLRFGHPRSFNSEISVHFLRNLLSALPPPRSLRLLPSFSAQLR